MCDLIFPACENDLLHACICQIVHQCESSYAFLDMLFCENELQQIPQLQRNSSVWLFIWCS